MITFIDISVQNRRKWKEKQNLPFPSNVKSSWKIPLGFKVWDNPLYFLVLPSGLTAPPTGLGLYPLNQLSFSMKERICLLLSSFISMLLARRYLSCLTTFFHFNFSVHIFSGKFLQQQSTFRHKFCVCLLLLP